MGHRLDIASGKNEFDRRLGNFRVQIKRGDEGEHIATITASIWRPGDCRNTNGPAAFRPRSTFPRPRPMHCGWRFLF
jgi:hypothetical protein